MFEILKKKTFVWTYGSIMNGFLIFFFSLIFPCLLKIQLINHLKLALNTSVELGNAVS